jgi:hypothetical protein
VQQLFLSVPQIGTLRKKAQTIKNYGKDGRNICGCVESNLWLYSKFSKIIFLRRENFNGT